jgi:CheY-like chemotaxis protein
MALVCSLTSAGQDALASDVGEGDFPLEVGGHEEVIRGRLRRFPDQLINEWLKELEELKMVEPYEAGELDAVTFTGARLPLLPPLSDEERKRLAKTTDLGADGYITKPYSKNQLAEVIGRVLKH